MTNTPITLSTLPRASRQDVFDQVARHLLTQRVKATAAYDVAEEVCHYRGAPHPQTGAPTACAAGCLIADHEYNERLEGQGWRSMARNGIVPGTHAALIQTLQGIHDQCPVDDWPEELRNVARHNRLSTDVLQEFGQ